MNLGSGMSPEVLAKIRQIEASSRRLVDNIFAGKYKSVFKNRGIEFSGIREYAMGDDVRLINWQVTARVGIPYMKQFVPERELTVVFLIDASASSDFGTYKQTKSALLAEVAAILAYAAIFNGDHVGLLIFTEEIERFIKPKKGRKHVLRVIHEILTFKPKHRGTNLSRGLRGLNEIFRSHATVFLFSDFLAKDYDRELRASHSKHDIICIALEDRVERDFPPLGLVNLEDAETGELMRINSSRPAWRQRLRQEVDAHYAKRDRLFKSCNIDHITISTDQPYVDPLVKFFGMRQARIKA